MLSLRRRCFGLFLLLSLLSLIKPSHQQDCSASNPCPSGCCGKSGWCGLGPEFCGKDTCVGDCNRKSECDPGWGLEWSVKSKCPLNVCCSKFGFCGTTETFCGKNTVERPKCSGTKIDKVIGYYESWSLTERSCYGMLPEEIPYGVYTHINFAFVSIDPSSFKVRATSTGAEELMNRIGNLKLLQPNLQIWIAIGGWTFNDANQPTARTFSELAASESRQDAFADSLLSMMNTYGFEGVDIDWEYPVAPDRSGSKGDYENFVTWMKRLKVRLGKKGLSLTLPSSYWYLQHFDVVGLEKHVDWFNVMLYDLHGAWDDKNEWTGPFLNAHTNLTEIGNALDLLWRNKISPDKVVFGMAFYGRSFTMTNPSCSEPGCTFASGGTPGKCSDTVGVLLNAEINDIIKENKLSTKLYKDAVKTIRWGNQWVSFDDLQTWRMKGQFLKDQCIKDIMVWAISQDDRNGTQAKALLGGLGKDIMGSPNLKPQPVQEPPKVIKTCRWSNCLESCPPGFKNVMRDGTSQTMVDGTGCAGGAPHQWCCPGDFELPKCTWRGHKNSGACKPGCNDGEVEVGTLTVGCSSRHQSACCTKNTATMAYGSCKWVGESGLCSKSGSHKDCPSDYPKFVVASSVGAGGEQVCTQGAKSYCCKDPIPSQFTDCKWYTKETNYLKTQSICEPSCPKDSIRLSMQRGDCAFSYGAYCCKGQPAPKIEPRDPNMGNSQYNDFVSLLKDYMNDSSCPAKLSMPHYDYFYDKPTKRSRLEPRQSHKCSAANLARLVNWISMLVASPSVARDTPALTAAWDNLVAHLRDNSLLYLNLVKWRENSFWDPKAMMEDILMNLDSAGPGIKKNQVASAIVCEVLSSSSAKRGIVSHDNWKDTLQDRHILPYFWDATKNKGSFDFAPTVFTIFKGIANGALALNYARWQHYAATTSQTGALPDIFLEVAYWIGPIAGVAPTPQQETALNLAQYRDGAHGTSNRWVVFHFHFDTRNPALFRQHPDTGEFYIGTTAIRMFHGGRAYDAGMGRRVANDRKEAKEENTRSAVVTCRAGTRFYLGTNAMITPGGDPFNINSDNLEFTLRGWGHLLRNINHLVDRTGLSRVFDFSTNPPTLRTRDHLNAIYRVSFIFDSNTNAFNERPNIPY